MNETGFYRVKYDKEIEATLLNALEANMLSSMEKIGKHVNIQYEDLFAMFIVLKCTLTLCMFLGIVENSLVLSMALEDTLSSLLYILYACHEEADYRVLKHVNDVCTSQLSNYFHYNKFVFENIIPMCILLWLYR